MQEKIFKITSELLFFPASLLTKLKITLKMDLVFHS